MPPRNKRTSGAAEHAYRPGPWGYGSSEHHGTSSGHTRPGAWNGMVAFANIGLPGAAVSGSQWTKKHRARLIKLVTDLFHESQHCDGRRHELNGILLNEVGNMSDLCDENCKKKFDEMMTAAFDSATRTKPGSRRKTRRARKTKPGDPGKPRTRRAKKTKPGDPGKSSQGAGEPGKRRRSSHIFIS